MTLGLALGGISLVLVAVMFVCKQKESKNA